jgi:hypothetical protein
MNKGGNSDPLLFLRLSGWQPVSVVPGTQMSQENLVSQIMDDTCADGGPVGRGWSPGRSLFSAVSCFHTWGGSGVFCPSVTPRHIFASYWMPSKLFTHQCFE